MTERPIIISSHMMPAVLSQKKTQARFVIKPFPDLIYGGRPFLNGHGNRGPRKNNRFLKCPFGDVGSKLWVREPWRALAIYDNVQASDLPQSDVLFSPNYTFLNTSQFGKKRSSTHLPRWASRVTLEVKNIRVEQVQSITESDAESEGIGFLRDVPDVDETLSARELFEAWFDSVHGAGSWDRNPWLWVVEFEALKQPQTNSSSKAGGERDH